MTNAKSNDQESVKTGEISILIGITSGLLMIVLTPIFLFLGGIRLLFSFFKKEKLNV